LSKLFVIQKAEGKQMKLWVEGQPKVNASFGHVNRPASLEVNGKAVAVDYKQSMLKVRY